MGTYLAVSIWKSVSVSKNNAKDYNFTGKELGKFLNEEIDFPIDIFECKEDDDNFIFELTQEVIQKELLHFLQKFYNVYFNYKDYYIKEIINPFKTTEPNKWAELIENNEIDEIMPESRSYEIGKKIFLDVDVWRITLEGKVSVEEMDRHLQLFEYALQKAFSKFKIAKMLNVELV